MFEFNSQDIKYVLDILDEDTVKIKVNWGLRLEYAESIFVDVKFGKIIWKSYDDRLITKNVQKYFDKMFKNKVFL